ncbi:MAG TPA: spore germination protein GerW family protein [Synergistales bacterium]|nr:spore germination protein GerW family protein [Synergistales bacterium]
MRRSVLLLVITILILLPAACLAQNAVDEQADMARAIVSQIRTILDANNVIGEPVIVQGNTILPVVAIFFGFASGRGMQHMDIGAGGGGCGGVIPVSMLTLTRDGDIKVVEARKNQFAEMIRGIAMAYMEMMREGYSMEPGMESSGDQ